MLLHGVGTSSSEWSWVLPDLARNHLVYAIDLPGYEGSYEPPDYAPAFTASFVNSFLDAVGVERAVVVGNSFGGLVASSSPPSAGSWGCFCGVRSSLTRSSFSF